MRIRLHAQYSLRSFLALVTIGCLALGRWVESARVQRDAVDAILGAGGHVIYDYVPGRSPRQRRVQLNGIEDHSFWWDFWHIPTGIYAAYSKDGDTIISQLYYLPAVTDVDLPGCRITHQGMSGLKHWQSPRSLNLRSTNITDADVKQLGNLVGLRSLNLERTKISDEALPHLKRIKDIKRIDIDYTRVTKVGARSIQDALPSCSIIW